MSARPSSSFVVLALGSLVACKTLPPPRPPMPGGPKPTIAMDTPSTQRPWRALDHVADAKLTLPEALPPGDTSTSANSGVIALTETWADTGKTYGRMRIWSHPLPFACEMPRPNYAPLGAQLFRGTAEFPFVGGMTAPSRGGWFIEDNNVMLISLENPLSWSEKPELRVTELAHSLQRLSFATSGMTAAEFVRFDATAGPETRPGLLLPAPARAEFEVTVPAGGVLDVGATLLVHPLLGDDAGNGATARVEVDGESIWRAAVRPGSGFANGSLDLSRWGGKTVKLAFVSDPDGDAAYDSVFFSTPVVYGPLPAPRHIVVVGIDTLRWDALSLNGHTVDGRTTSPELDAWAQSAVVFDDAWGPAPRTRPSFRTALTGRYPYDAIAAPTIAEALAPEGFRTAGFAANVHLVPRFRFNDGFEEWYYENGAKAEDQVSRALDWLRAHQDEDTFTFVHLMDPHTYYNAPEPWGSRFTEGRSSRVVPDIFDRWQILQLMRRKKLTDDDKRLIRGRYDGEVAYLSAALGTLFDGVDAMHGKAVTLLHSDHGEEFWDHGGYEHNHTLYSELVHTQLMVRPPGGWGGGPHRVPAAVGLIDIVPTLLDVVGLNHDAAGKPWVSDGLSLRTWFDAGVASSGRADTEAALGATLHARPLALGHLMFDKERWGVVLEDWKYILQTESGEEELYDLATDPGELKNRVGDAPPGRLAAMQQGLSQATGWPLSDVWRIELHGTLDALRVTLGGDDAGKQKMTAGVIDPEAGEQTRANLEWGEHPRLVPADVGDVRSDAPGSWTFRPARAAGQTLYFACPTRCPDGTVAGAAGVEAPLVDGEIALGAMKLRVQRGVMLRPTRTEADALATLPSTAGTSQEMEQLKLLGYVAPPD